MISIRYEGRLGNCLFQYSAARIFAQKFGLRISRDSNTYLAKMAGPLVNYVQDGIEIHSPVIVLDDSNYFQLLGSDSVPQAHYVLSSGMQNPTFIQTCLSWMRETIKLDEIEKEDNSLLVHVRLGDCDGSPRRLPIEYYQDAIRNTAFSKGYICSDTMDHPDVENLMEEFGLIPYDIPAVQILKNSKQFDKMILSEGTFSWWLGSLSDASEIVINRRLRDHQWHGDIFVFPNWKETLYCS